jgi:hypothetical protein
MIEVGQNLPLALKALDRIIGDRAAAYELDRDLPSKRFVGARSQKNRAHPSVSDLAHDSIGSNLALSRFVGRMCRVGIVGCAGKGKLRRAGECRAWKGDR